MALLDVVDRKAAAGPAYAEPVVFDLARDRWNADAMLSHLDQFGFVHIRNLLSPEDAASLAGNARALLERPAVAGTVGYAKVDHPKKLANPFLLRKPFVKLAADKRIIDLVERYMASDCILAEANLKYDSPVGYEYFALHADFGPGWRKTATSEPVLTAADLEKHVGVGGAFYLHETHSGAFSYSLGTHKLKAHRGQNLSQYPVNEQQQILAAKKRLDGLAGDLILFDDRGFHGPDQPALAERTVILLDYYRVETFGLNQVTPLLAYTADLAGLDAHQMRVLGVGAGEMIAPEQYLLTKFRRTKAYNQCVAIIENAYRSTHLKAKLKQKLGPRGEALVRKLLGRSLGGGPVKQDV